MAADKKKTNAIAIAVIIVAIAMVLIAFSARSEKSSIEQVGDFKSEARTRLMSFKSPEADTEEQARELLDGLPWTPDRLTLAVIYEGTAQAPADGLTHARDFTAATAVVHDPPFPRWTWHMSIVPNGRRGLSRQDCPTTSDAPCEEMQTIFVEDPS